MICLLCLQPRLVSPATTSPTYKVGLRASSITWWLLRTSTEQRTHSTGSAGLWKTTMVELKLLTAACYLLFLQFSSTMSTTPALPPHGRCIARERDALLAFKAGLADPGNYHLSLLSPEEHHLSLSSWEGAGCCEWVGVRCSNRTGHVLELHLQRLELEVTSSSSLLALHQLRWLDLSMNNFSGAPIPEFIGGLKNLRHLDLSDTNFSGRVPPHLGNLSKLHYLDLGQNNMYSTDLAWLSRLTALQYLDLSYVNLSAIIDWAHIVNKLPSLVTLNLESCELQNTMGSPLQANLTSLEHLDLSGNKFSSSLGAKNLFWYLPSLVQFDMGMSGLEGPIPDAVGNMTSIKILRLYDNNLTGTIPATFKNLRNLEELELHVNNINGPVATLLGRLHGKSLDQLILFENSLTGNLPDQLGHLRNLTFLDLSNNLLSGKIPLGIGGFTKLTELMLGENNFDGAITERHFVQLANLKLLDLSQNSLAMVVHEKWVPPFNLDALDLQSCRLGPKFPEWLRSQISIVYLDISNTSIAGAIPVWFWTTFSRTWILVLSSNQISGMLPSAMFQEMEAFTMDLSRNFLVGPIPKLPSNLASLDLSRNNLSGPLPSDFGGPMLSFLFVFDNSLSGRIPNSFCHMKMLEFVDLSGNLLEGTLPNCGVQSRAGNSPSNHSSELNRLTVLNLNGNNFSGSFPLFLQSCQELIFLDIAHNKFQGNMPTWIGEKLPSLAYLSVRSNLFSGHIPLQLSSLTELQYLDLACNLMSGSIPVSLMKLMAMTFSPADNDSLEYVGHHGESAGEVDFISYAGGSLVVTKGQQLEYTTGIMYMVNFDLSCNNLTGPIPVEIGELVALKSLNLSWNHLSGTIPDRIGELRSLESLDLSHNEFFGEIPATLSALTSLSHLNMSYNNLTGQIPSGNQLQTLDEASIYIGNPGLCGFPLSKNCSEIKVNPTASEEDGHGNDDAVSFFLGTLIGYVMGLWIVFCAFLFKRKWRVVWFSFFDSFCGRVYVQLAIRWAYMTKTNETDSR